MMNVGDLVTTVVSWPKDIRERPQVDDIGIIISIHRYRGGVFLVLWEDNSVEWMDIDDIMAL